MSLHPQWIIPLLLFLPILFAGGLLLPIPALSQRKTAWLYSTLTSTISLCMTAIVVWKFDWSAPTMQLTGEIPWIPSFGLSLSYGVDAISLWLILLTTFLMPIVVMGSLIEVDHDMRTFHFWLHILEAALIGTFIARDLVMFYVCFEFTLIPLYFLIGQFGHTNRIKAARVYFLYSLAGSLLALAAMLYVAYFNAALDPALFEGAGRWTLDIATLWEAGRAMPFHQQAWVFFGLMIGFSIKLPLWPLHTWLPLAHTEAPTAGSVDLAGLVLKLGPYGMLRIVLPMCPLAAVYFAPVLGTLATIGVVYAALICWVQTDAKKLVAYSSVSHMGFAALGLFAFDQESIGAVGAVVYMVSHGLATGGLFLCIGMVYDRFHTRELSALSGLARHMPIWAGFFGFFIMASVGLPGLNGFVGEFLTLLGTFASPMPTSRIFAVIATTGVILAAIYLLYLLGRVCFGPVKLPGVVHGKLDEQREQEFGSKAGLDLSKREICVVAPLALVCLLIGLYPYPMLRSLEEPVAALTAAAREQISQAQRQTAEAQPQLRMDQPEELGRIGVPAADASQLARDERISGR